MNRYVFLAVLMLLPLAVSAQKKQKVSPPSIEQLMAEYRFGEAVERLRTEIATARRRRKPTADMEAQLAEAQHLAVAVEATQQVTFVDSVVLPKADMLQAIRMSSESGRLTTLARAFGRTGDSESIVFQSQLGQLTIFAQPTDEGGKRLHSSTIEGGRWSTPEPLRGLADDDTEQNYPFVLQDGLTLYYGAVNPGGLGGYDIYCSRYDADDHSYRVPENVGMPFNSPANDYLMAIDEYSNLGYLVTDRRQPADSVCVYTFVPPTVRVNLTDLGLDDEALCRQAALFSIAATQTDAVAVADALKRKMQLSMAQQAARQYEFTFVVDDSRVYHYASQFQSEGAKGRLDEWKKLKSETDGAVQQLDAMRRIYASANASRRSSLRSQILTMEAAYEQNLKRMAAVENDMRRAEQNIK